MRSLFLLLAGLTLMAYPVVGVVRPLTLPAGLRSDAIGAPSFRQAYERWEAELNSGDPTEALAWVDELLFAIEGTGEFARDAEAMRELAINRGGVGPERWRDRGQPWRWRRIVERRPLSDAAASVVGLALVLFSVLETLRARRERRKRRRQQAYA